MLKAFVTVVFRLKAAKIKQRGMEDMITRLDCYSPNKKYKTQRESVLFNAREFDKRRIMIFITFENSAFPLAKQYPSGNVDDWKESV